MYSYSIDLKPNQYVSNYTDVSTHDTLIYIDAQYTE